MLFPGVCLAHNSVSMGYGILYLLGSIAAAVVNFHLTIINYYIKKRWLRILTIILIFPQFWLLYFFGMAGGSYNLWIIGGTILEVFLIIKSVKKNEVDETVDNQG